MLKFLLERKNVLVRFCLEEAVDPGKGHFESCGRFCSGYYLYRAEIYAIEIEAVRITYYLHVLRGSGKSCSHCEKTD